MEDISNIIKAGMRQKGISQQKLAKILAVSQGTISNILRNPNTLPIAALARIAKVLEIEQELKATLFNSCNDLSVKDLHIKIASLYKEIDYLQKEIEKKLQS